MYLIGKSLIEEMLKGISMRGTRFEEWDFEWEVRGPLDMMDWNDEGFLIRCSFERPDAETGEMARGWGRGWWIGQHSSPEQVVFTAWLAIKQIVDHELHESFVVNVKGEQVRLLDPHKSLADLAVGSARVPDVGESKIKGVLGTGRAAREGLEELDAKIEKAVKRERLLEALEEVATLKWSYSPTGYTVGLEEGDLVRPLIGYGATKEEARNALLAQVEQVSFGLIHEGHQKKLRWSSSDERFWVVE